MNTTNRYSTEFKQRAVRLVGARTAGQSIGMGRDQIRLGETGVYAGDAETVGSPGSAEPGVVHGIERTDEHTRLKALERENKELRRANEIFKTAFGFFCPGGARPQTEMMVSYIDEHRDRFGVEPICKELPIAPFDVLRPQGEAPRSRGPVRSCPT